MGKNNILKLGGKSLSIENWKVYHPNGNHMFTCGDKKAKWYINRNLAVIIGDNKIKLTFKPKGTGFTESEEFGRSVRENKCVVTGIDAHLQRHHIVPYCYRTYFPPQYKSKNHHDVVLINDEKHSEYEIEATKFKDELARVYDIMTIDEYNNAYIRLIRNQNRENSIIMSRLKVIFQGYGYISTATIYENLKLISEYTNIDFNFLKDCNYIQLYKLYRVLSRKFEHDSRQFQARHKKYYDHGFHLVAKLDTDEKIQEFVRLWRQHFIDTMNPQFMPKGWSINFRHKTNI